MEHKGFLGEIRTIRALNTTFWMPAGFTPPKREEILGVRGAGEGQRHADLVPSLVVIGLNLGAGRLLPRERQFQASWD